MGHSDTAKAWILLGLALALLLGAAVAMVCGVYEISAGEVRGVLLARVSSLFGGHAETSRLHDTIVWDLRLPRVILAVTVGMALAASGAVYQGCFRNPLVEPYILGISSGAAFGAALGIVFPGFRLSVQAGALLFGGVAVAVTYLLARVRGETPALTLILAGVVVGSVFTALVSILKYAARDASLREIVFWMMGGFYYAGWRDVAVAVPVVVGGCLVVWALGWKLNILSMGDEEARTLGVSAERYRLVLVFLATLITSVSVSVAGVVAWVGLMMPHAARMILGPDHRFVIPGAALAGGLYLLLCDTLARTVGGSEIPIGIVTSLLGSPYLFYLLRAKGRSILG